MLERVLRLSKADQCIAIGRLYDRANVRWANNTVTTNGVTEQAELSVVSIIGRRVASVTRTYFPDDRLEEIVRESEQACQRRPEAPDYMPLPSDNEADEWGLPPLMTDIHVFDRFMPALADTFTRARRSNVLTFGYAEHGATTVWVAASTGLRKRHADRTGKIEVTAKSQDFSRSSWVGAATEDFSDLDPRMMLDTLERRLDWSSRRLELPAGSHEVLVEPSCAIDLAISAYFFMTKRDADEGRSPYSSPGGGTRIGERLFGNMSMYSDPKEPKIGCTPFHVGLDSGAASSVFDNGARLARTDWVRNGTLSALITPRYWAAKTGMTEAAPYINNLVVPGDGPSMEQMIAETERALLVTCFWYIRTVDPQTALQTGLTRDGVYLIERGEVKGAVNNFRWNMSPIAALSQTTQIGRSGPALPREHDEFPRTKAPALRIERFNMSSVSEAS